MTFPADSRFHFAEDMPICRILNGMWQVSGAHGRIDPATAIRSMFDYVDAGLTTWDLADHYGPAEDFIGEFRRQLVTERGPGGVVGCAGFHQVGSPRWADDPRSGGKQH